jgi:ActR/RegA family two-component response regulator
MCRKILFLDDSDTRLKQAEIAFDGEELYLARTAEKAIRLIATVQPWDLVMLDHDLGQYMQDSEDPGSGMEVVRYIEQALPEIKKIIIHSWNPPAASEMCSRLARQGYNVDYRPFQSLQGV